MNLIQIVGRLTQTVHAVAQDVVVVAAIEGGRVMMMTSVDNGMHDTVTCCLWRLLLLRLLLVNLVMVSGIPLKFHWGNVDHLSLSMKVLNF